MRLVPLESRSLLIVLARLASRRALGRVIAPLEVLYPRVPRLLWPQLGMFRYFATGTSLSPRTRVLVETYVSLQNGCGFCSDLHAREAERLGIARETVLSLPDFERSAAFSEAERAALAWARSVARHETDDDRFTRARTVLGEQALVEVTLCAAFTTYLNLTSAALGLESDGFCAWLPLPGRASGDRETLRLYSPAQPRDLAAS